MNDLILIATVLIVCLTIYNVAQLYLGRKDTWTVIKRTEVYDGDGSKRPAGTRYTLQNQRGEIKFEEDF